MTLKSFSITALLLGSVFVLFQLFYSRFTLGYSPQGDVNSCLRGTWFLVDRSEKDIAVGNLYAFHLPVHTPFFDKGRRFIKRAVANEGEIVNIGLEVTVTTFGRIELPLRFAAKALGDDPQAYVRVLEVKESHWFAMGELPQSYDSRFWGQVPHANVIGRAYALF
ncbi:S26 family signal peptidase [Ferrimonas kyonanensis]|uniref:S26 family signal peptidase n=1 Tax=Ferrimonas kyonanensis TaxID=364763 RepID=UPI000480E2E0|nr:S26 family signal peptidase [Ferrimonas kyonanensis]